MGCSICTYIDSNRNTISEWAVIFRYGNFFIPWVKKSSIISPWEKNLASRGPTALGKTRFFALGLICEDFSTLGMKKFPYLITGPFGNPIFLLFKKGLAFISKSWWNHWKITRISRSQKKSEWHQIDTLPRGGKSRIVLIFSYNLSAPILVQCLAHNFHYFKTKHLPKFFLGLVF